MNYVKTIKKLLEELYNSYTDNDGEMVIIDELSCYIYKGKNLHFDQNLIMYSSNDGTIRIDGSEEDNSIWNKSYIKIKEDKEIPFILLDENSEEFKFLNNIIEIIDKQLNPNTKKH